MVDEEETANDKAKESSMGYVSQNIIDLSKEMALDVSETIKENYLIGWINN